MAPQVVLITGCSSGMGLATAALLAKEKDHKCKLAGKQAHRFKVYATMRNLGSKGNLEAAAGGALNKTLFIRALDVTKQETISSVVDEILRENGRIDVLINNAGFSGVDGIDLKSIEWCQAMMDTNYWGVVRTTRAVLPAMKKQNSGRILNVSSVAGVLASPFYSTYASSKYAVEGYSESMAAILRDGYNIRVSLIEPGPVATELMSKLMTNQEAQIEGFDDKMSKMFRDLYKNYAPILETATQKGEDIAKLILDVISSDKPHLRYQTSPAMTQMVSGKLKDPTTDAMLDVLKQ